ncbi:MAG TPA: hypothetical protein VIH87_01315 [Methylocella sp.]
MYRALVVPIVLFLVACSGEPKFKADTEANFNASFAEVAKRLSAEDKETLDAALKDIVLVQVHLYGPMLEAKSYQLPSNEPGAELTRTLTETFTGAASRIIYAATAARWDENRAKATVGNARAIVDGRTAKEIIKIAADERKKALEIAIATNRDQLEKAKSALNDIQAEAENAAKRQTERKGILEKIVITKPRFFYRKDGFTDKPVISFNYCE